MQNFWTFYQNLENITNPFRLFSVSHLFYVVLTFSLIVLFFKLYKKSDAEGKLKWQRNIALYFFIEELLYYIWVYISCTENAFFEILSLELCTICAFVNFSTRFHQNRQARFFSIIIGFFGGLIAIIYPANVIDVYPAVSYRLINFFMLHGMFILFAFMLLEDNSLMDQMKLKRNIVIGAVMFTLVFIFNVIFHTHYMFVGIPPKVSIIATVYELMGKILFLPVIIFFFSIIQILVYLIVKKIRIRLY